MLPVNCGAITIQLHQFLSFSKANGPGRRAVLWFQGCSLGCKGCFNPETHAFSGGQTISVEVLFQQIMVHQQTIEGITLSGGEPLQQLEGLLALLQRVRKKTKLSIILFSGFTWLEIKAMPKANLLLNCVDVLIAGRYQQLQRAAHTLRGSTNKTIHFLTNRYGLSDLEVVPATEIIITPEGELIISGIDPPERLI